MANFFQNVVDEEKKKYPSLSSYLSLQGAISLTSPMGQVQTTTPQITTATTPGVNFFADVIQGTLRSAARVGMEVGKIGLGIAGVEPKTEIQPKSWWEKLAFGKKPITDIPTYGKETLQAFGVSEEKAKKYGLAAGIGLTALDLSWGGGKSGVAKTIVRTATMEGAEGVIKKLGLNYSDDLAKKIINTKTTQEATSLLDDIAKQAVKKKLPFPPDSVVDEYNKLLKQRLSPTPWAYKAQSKLDALHKKYDFSYSQATKGIEIPKKINPIVAEQTKEFKSVNDFKDRGEFLGYIKPQLKEVNHPFIAGEKTVRPYVVGYGCDGSTDANIHYIAQKMSKDLGWDYAEIYNKAYPDSRGGEWIKSNLGLVKDEALKTQLVKDTTIIPKNSTIQNVLDDLYDINNRSLVMELENKFEQAKIPLDTKLSQLATKGIKEVAGEIKPAISEISAKSQNIVKEIPEALRPVSPKVPQMNEELSSIQKITQILKESKPLRGQQEKLYTAERAQKMAKALAVGEKTTGEAGFYRELGQLKGELPKVQFEEIKSKISQVDIDNLFKQVKDSKLLNFWDTISARGGLVKILNGRVPTESELTLLNRVFPKEFIEAVLSKRSLFEKFAEAGYQIANIPRSVMASFDVSAPFRQGLFLISHPKRFFGAFKDMFKSFGSEKAWQAVQESIVRKPTFDLMQQGKLALTEMDNVLTLREERFMSQWAERIPIVGRIIRMSGRAYTGFLNKLRADVFDDLIVKANKLELTPRSNPDLVKEIASFVNITSGRGDLGGLQKAATALNSFFFSPRLMASRLTILNPVYYVKSTPFVRREALKSLFSVLGVGSTILGLSKLAGADVGIDPRSADFGKIIIGKTRIDVWGGTQQYVRMFGQVFSGQYVSSVTGKLVTLGEGYKPLTRFEIIQRQIEAKEAPVFSLITALLKGQNFMGEKISIPKEIANRFIPMALQDIYDIAKNDPEVLPLSGAGLFGFGLQTYSGEIPTEKEKKDTYEISKILGEQAREREELSNASKLIYEELKKLPKEQAKTEFDRLIQENPDMAKKINDLIKDEQLGLTYSEKMLKQLGVENGEQAKFIFGKLNELKTNEEKRSYYQNLIDKKVITKQVSEQILELLK